MDNRRNRNWSLGMLLIGAVVEFISRGYAGNVDLYVAAFWVVYAIPENKTNG